MPGNSMNIVAMCIGYIIMCLAAGGAIAATAIWVSLLSNRAQHALLNSFGGWKVFMEYRTWLNERKTDSSARDAE